MLGSLARVWLAAAGVTTGTIYGFSTTSVLPGAAAALAGAALLAVRARVAVVGLCGVAFGLGAISGTLRAHDPSALAAVASGVPRCRIEGAVTEQAGGLGTLARVDLLVCERRAGASGTAAALEDAGEVVLEAPAADPGAELAASGWLLPLGSDGFDRARARLGADAFFDIADIELRPPDSPLLGLAARLRAGLRNAAARLDERRGALLQGLSIGDTTGFDPVTIDRFRRAGLSHLLAVSGSNVAIVLGAVAALARPLGHRGRLALGFGALGLFTLVVGPEPSVLRAAIMGGISLGALAFGARAEPMHALGVALIALIAFRPAMVFSVGLHLSVAATAGIVLWSAGLRARLGVGTSVLAQALGVTLAAQVAVAPILVGTFGELSLTGPLANLLALPAVVPATVLGLVAGVAGALEPAAGVVAARLADPFAAWVLLSGDLLGGPEWAAAALPPFAALVLALPVVLVGGIAVRALAGK